MTTKLSFENLYVGYGRRAVLESVSGELEAGDWIHVFGKNGSGKTSLLQALASFHYPLGGLIQWNGTDIHTCKEQYRSKLRYFGHEVGLYERLTVSDNWELFKGLFGMTRSNPQSFTENIPVDTVVEDLSRGQKRRVELASLLASPREIAILDEPLASLDREAAESLIENLRMVCDEGGIVLSASPDPVDFSDTNWKTKNGSLIKLQ